ncbi:hypothetical protein KCP75_09630 [Salmonella enterica subsp. enterica]|nr:hypothetical protein KCP75_09630 [Salmonella enterica subsp. enterica]
MSINACDGLLMSLQSAGKVDKSEASLSAGIAATFLSENTQPHRDS